MLYSYRATTLYMYLVTRLFSCLKMNEHEYCVFGTLLSRVNRKEIDSEVHLDLN